MSGTRTAGLLSIIVFGAVYTVLLFVFAVAYGLTRAPVSLFRGTP